MTISIQETNTASEPSTVSELKSRIKAHYDVCSSYYLSLWGQHIHHGYWTSEPDLITKELAQIHLIELLLSRAGYPCTSIVAGELSLPSDLRLEAHEPQPEDQKLKVLDVGCGVGGTTRYLAEHRGWDVTGITISSEQVKLAYGLSEKAAMEKNKPTESSQTPVAFVDAPSGERIQLGKGSVQFLQMDAEKMGDHFESGSYDIVWISEALSHLPDKTLFFTSAAKLLKPGGRLVIADWLKAPGLTEEEFEADVAPIESGMLLPPLDTIDGYLSKAKSAGLEVRKGGEPMDIGDNVKRTWDISISLVASPSLWAIAFTQGRDFVAFLKAFQAMRRGFNNKNFRYGVVVFEKVE